MINGNKTKENQGITLVALIITIIILIILAAVTINTAFKLDILEIAGKAAEDYTKEQYKEKEEFDKLSENMDDVIEKIEMLELGTNKIWKKEHQVRVKVKGDTDKIKSIKYQWTDSTIEPEPNTFTNIIENGEMLIENTLTGQYYLWTLIEETSGNLRIKRSEVYYFDNTAPTGEIKTEYLEEEGKEKLKIIVTNINDEHSGLNDNSIKLFITPENGTREEKKITLTDGEGSIIVDNEGVTKVELTVTDNAGNKLEKQESFGRVYILRNGEPVRGDVRHWATRKVCFLLSWNRLLYI